MEPSSETKIFLRLLSSAYDDANEAWHGPTLLSSIRRVKEAEAVWRPGGSGEAGVDGSGRNIWEITIHAAYWKYVVIRRLTGAKRGSFPRKGSNWFDRPAPADAEAVPGWEDDLALLQDMHTQLLTAVRELPSERIQETPEGSKVSNFTLITGVAAHDVYHAGQIQSIRQWYRAR